MSREVPSHELESLLIACIEDVCDRQQVKRIEKAVDEDPATLIAYVNEMRMHTMLQWRYSAQPDARLLDEPLRPVPRFANRRQGTNRSVVPASAPAIVPRAVDRATYSPAPTFLHNTLGFFPEGMPLAYMVATVVTGLGILIASHIYVSGPNRWHDNPAALPSPPSLTSYPPSVVGRITGLVDCKWEKKGLRIGDWGLRKGLRGQGSGARDCESRIPNP